MDEIKVQAAKAKQLYKLHHTHKLLILPNIWDVLGARLLQHLGYEAIATASASVAYANGFDDGENISFEAVLCILKNIVNAVDLPVTADIETGYARNNDELENNIRKIIEAGIVGINIEDTHKESGELFSIKEQCKKIELIKKVAAEVKIDLFINARTDTFIHQKKFTNENDLMHETVRRGKAYEDSGADCFYPILMHQQKQIETIIKEVNTPLNVLMIQGLPDLKIIEKIGVARLSLGPGYLKFAIKAMKELALKLKNYEGLNDVVNNEITSDYLKHLVTS